MHARNDFTIHGLWPNYNDGTYPQNCDHKNPFNPAALKPLLDRMDSEWPSFAGPDNTFWKHEWDKHGTCAESVFASEFEYFQTTLGLHEQDDLLVRTRCSWQHCADHELVCSQSALSLVYTGIQNPNNGMESVSAPGLLPSVLWTSVAEQQSS